MLTKKSLKNSSNRINTVLLLPLPYSWMEFGKGLFLLGGDALQSLRLVNCYLDIFWWSRDCDLENIIGELVAKYPESIDLVNLPDPDFYLHRERIR